MAKRILVVDDDPTQRRILEEMIKRLSYQTVTASDGAEALAKLEQTDGSDISLVLLDLVMPGVGGQEVLDHLRNRPNTPPVIVQTANCSIDTAINAMRSGAADFVIKPVSSERLDVSIKNALKIDTLQDEIVRIKHKTTGQMTFDDMIIQGEEMRRVSTLGKKAAGSNIPVLIEGESGVGKELIARAIQGESERAGTPFVTVNCGAIPENLVESILFGHEKGSFTGAVDKRKGKFLEADGGTLFLDEVGELPLDAQVKLLRALQEGEVDPVGGKKTVKVDFRLIAATNRDMIELVKEGKFREDLYYRLNVFPVMVPPLRDRTGDIDDLAPYFITRFAAEESKKIDGLHPDASRLLKAYNWPGNVRQLENAIFRAVVLSDGPQLTIDDFPQIAAHVEGFEATVPAAPAPASDMSTHEGPAIIGDETTVPHTIEVPSDIGANIDTNVLGIPAMTNGGEIRPLDAIEADMIRLALGKYRGHMTEVAKRLGIGRSTLYRKMREFGLEARLN